MPHKNKILLSAIAGVAIYLVWMALTDWESITNSMQSISVQGLIVVLSLSLLNYVLRFVRWAWYLRSFGYVVPTLHNFNCYFAGFAFTTTPGKAGEALRSVFLEKYGVRIWHTVACVLTERIIDLICVAVLAALGIALFPGFLWIVGSVLLVFCLFIAAARSGYLRSGWARFVRLPADSKLAKHAAFLADKWSQIQNLWTTRIVAGGVALGLASWGAEAIGLAVIVAELGHEAPLVGVVAIYALSMLAGAVSMMPGGLGGAEASMTLLLTTIGMSLPEAVSATLICRAATLWFAVGLGAIALIPATAAPGLSVSRS